MYTYDLDLDLTTDFVQDLSIIFIIIFMFYFVIKVNPLQNIFVTSILIFCFTMNSDIKYQYKFNALENKPNTNKVHKLFANCATIKY